MSSELRSLGPPQNHPSALAPQKPSSTSPSPEKGVGFFFAFRNPGQFCRLAKVPKKPHHAVVKSVRDLAFAAKRHARGILDEARQVRQTVIRSRRTLSKMLGGDRSPSSRQ
jgi:hypothetical protein